MFISRLRVLDMTARVLVIHRCIAVLTLLCCANMLAADEPTIETVGDAAHRFVSVGKIATQRSDGDRPVRYVLLDQDGAILNRLRPADELDLSPYVGMEVGVTAQMLVDGDVPILLAERVTVFGEAPEATIVVDDGGEVAPVVHQEEVLPGPPVLMQGEQAIVPSLETPVEFGSPVVGTHHLDDSYLGTSIGYPGIACGDCGDPGCTSGAGCPCGPFGPMWLRAEYLLWWTDGMNTPPLVTTSTPGTARSAAGVLGASGTSVLFGGDELLDGGRSGGRFRLGKWLDRCQWIGFETEFLFLGDESDAFLSSVGTQIVARPFFNTVLQRQDSELVSFPGEVDGTIAVNAETSLFSFSPRFRINLACESVGGGCGSCNDCASHGSYRFDLLLGYRYVNLEDDLNFRENLGTVDPASQTFFDLRDSFSTDNDFHGVDLGILWEGYRGPWSLELISRIALGNNHQRVRIHGSTSTTAGATTFDEPGGLLALSSNSGSFSRDEFTVIPEVGATLGFAIAPRARVTVGYSFLYWSEVIRAGDQINLNVNPNFIPGPAVPNPGVPNPTFAFRDTDFWAHGLNLGLDYRW